MTEPLRPAVFFDRDGVLNLDHGYVHKWDSFDWVEGAKEAIKLFNESGYLVFVVTNQAGVAHGYYEEEAVLTLHRSMQKDLAAIGAHIDQFEYCPHHPKGVSANYKRICACRKPEAGMLLKCMKTWPVDKAKSFLVGDRDTDIQAAEAAGIKGHLFSGGDLFKFMEPLLVKALA